MYMNITYLLEVHVGIGMKVTDIGECARTLIADTQLHFTKFCGLWFHAYWTDRDVFCITFSNSLVNHYSLHHSLPST